MLADALQSRGATCIAVESSILLPELMKSRFEPGAFPDIVQHDSDLEQTLAAVKLHHPTHVMAGAESGVELAERMAAQLGLPGNDPEWIEARRDKFLMNEAVRTRGLATADQFRANDVEEILDWIQNTLDWPVIVKPPKSVASDQVFCCSDENAVRIAAQLILSSENVLGERNPNVLVQEFLAGTEYALDIVCCEGQKKTTAIWEYSRPEGGDQESCTGYNAMTLMPYLGERQQALEAYAFDVLDALGIRFGPAHCELIWRNDRPVLVEVGARLTAGNNAVLSRICGGICHLDETVEAILDPQHFLTTLNQQPRLQRLAANVFLTPQRKGRLIRLHGLDTIRRLPTLHGLSVRAKPGDRIDRVAGLVTLVDKDARAIERDVGVIRALERQGIFEVEQETSA